MRDKIGSFMSRTQCERFLNDWIRTYVVADDNASASHEGEEPLRDARVEVVDVPGKPGAYRAVAFLRPHFSVRRIIRFITSGRRPSGIRAVGLANR